MEGDKKLPLVIAYSPKQTVQKRGRVLHTPPTVSAPNCQPANVRSWHFSDIQPALTNVRFWGLSGHDSIRPLCRLMTQSGHKSL
jgi:hypothetical protein